MKQPKSSPSSLSPHFDLAFSPAYKKLYKAPTTFAMRRTTTARICIVQYVQCSMFGMVTYMNMANLARGGRISTTADYQNVNVYETR